MGIKVKYKTTTPTLFTHPVYIRLSASFFLQDYLNWTWSLRGFCCRASLTFSKHHQRQILRVRVCVYDHIYAACDVPLPRSLSWEEPLCERFNVKSSTIVWPRDFGVVSVFHEWGCGFIIAKLCNGFITRLTEWMSLHAFVPPDSVWAHPLFALGYTLWSRPPVTQILSWQLTKLSVDKEK